MAAKLPRILVVDDEPQIRRFLRSGLPPPGYEVIEAETASEALKRFVHERPDAVILDLGLPDRDGFAVLGEIRAAGLVPVVVLSARGDVEGKVRALEQGADDYVTKPFDMAELLARLKAALRHGLQAAGEAPVFQTGRLSVDLVKRQVRLDGAEVHLSPKEYSLLRFLVAHAGSVEIGLFTAVLVSMWIVEQAGSAAAAGAKLRHSLVNAVFMAGALPVQAGMTMLCVAVATWVTAHHVGLLYLLPHAQSAWVKTLGKRHRTATAWKAPIDAPPAMTPISGSPQSVRIAGTTSCRMYWWNMLRSHIRCAGVPSCEIIALPATESQL